MSKKRQKKSGTKKARPKQATRRANADDPIRADGVMSGMIGGFRRAVGVEKSKKSAPWNLVWAAILVIVALTILALNLAD